MSKITTEEKKRNKKLNEAFLYDLSYKHSENICDETDKLLEEYKNIEPPKSMDTWFEDYINEQKNIEKKKEITKYKKNILKRAAIFIVVIFTIGATITVSVEAFRLKFFNLFINKTEHYTDLSVLSEDNEEIKFDRPEDLQDYLYPTYLPDNYNLIDHFTIDGYYEFIFENDNNTISIHITNADNNINSHIDTENTELENITVNGFDGVYIFKDKMSTVAWLENDKLIEIVAPVNKDEILKIANSIKTFK